MSIILEFPAEQEVEISGFLGRLWRRLTGGGAGLRGTMRYFTNGRFEFELRLGNEYYIVGYTPHTIEYLRQGRGQADYFLGLNGTRYRVSRDDLVTVQTQGPLTQNLLGLSDEMPVPD